jgi:dTDP-4-dehydrorhamnose reductase
MPSAPLRQRMRWISKMRIFLLGANGQLGSDLGRTFASREWEVIPSVRSVLDVCNAEQLEAGVSAAEPDLVVNTTALHKVDECEIQPDRAFAVNATAPLNLARICEKIGATLVHFSSDYVFDGTKRAPYEVTDLPAPVNVYGASKVAGELLIAASMQKYFVVRTCGLYGVAGSSGKGGNFVETMLRKACEGAPIRVVSDQIVTPTGTRDLAEVVAELVQTHSYGLYHVTCEGACSWYEFARAIFEFAGVDPDVSPINSSEFPSTVKRPSYSVLSKTKLNSIGLCMPQWRDSLAGYLAEKYRAASSAKVHA